MTALDDDSAFHRAEATEEERARADRAEARLRELGIAFETVWHEAHFTVSESQADRSAATEGHTKNLFLKDKKSRYYLLIARDDAQIDLKGLHRQIGASGRVSFGSADRMVELLGVMPGSVTALAAMNDTAGQVAVFLDADLLEGDEIRCHPLTNRATTVLAPDGLMRFLDASDHAPTTLKLDEVSAT